MNKVNIQIHSAGIPLCFHARLLYFFKNTLARDFQKVCTENGDGVGIAWFVHAGGLGLISGSVSPRRKQVMCAPLVCFPSCHDMLRHPTHAAQWPGAVLSVGMVVVLQCLQSCMSVWLQLLHPIRCGVRGWACTSICVTVPSASRGSFSPPGLLVGHARRLPHIPQPREIAGILAFPPPKWHQAHPEEHQQGEDTAPSSKDPPGSPGPLPTPCCKHNAGRFPFANPPFVEAHEEQQIPVVPTHCHTRRCFPTASTLGAVPLVEELGFSLPEHETPKEYM